MWVYDAVVGSAPVPRRWRMETGGVIWPVPVAFLEGGLVLLATRILTPACRVTIGDWSAAVESERVPEWDAGYSVAWRRLDVLADAGSVAPDPNPDEIVLTEGLPLDGVSVPVLHAAMGGGELGPETARELARQRDAALRMVRERAPAAPAAVVLEAVVRIVGYISERPAAAASVWIGSGAGALLVDWSLQ